MIMKRVPLIILIVLIVISLIWFYPLIRSVAVMSAYSAFHDKNSIMVQKGFEIDIPGGTSTPKRDWYPFTITFNAGNFSGQSRMSIIYNFPAFDTVRRTSMLYNADSDYYSSFYGAYVIEKEDGSPYGIYGTNIDYDEISSAFRYDYINLVLKSFENRAFEFTPMEWDIKNSEYMGYDSWTVIDAVIKTSGTSHGYNGFRRSYLQYGRPVYNAGDEFPEVLMSGRLYIRYFSEYRCTIAMYIMSPDKDVLEACDSYILSKSRIIQHR